MEERDPRLRGQGLKVHDLVHVAVDFASMLNGDDGDVLARDLVKDTVVADAQTVGVFVAPKLLGPGWIGVCGKFEH